ncbi:MAG TPA: protease complex subunit PrcB family protein [Gemmatimonadaceae bacterium]|nr:protease complex subunit PrcB family protein [Gemmatimonadaceae bacterium]
MIRARQIFGVSLALACGADLAMAQLDTAGDSLPVTRLRTGATAYTTYSGLNDSVRAVVRDSTAWLELWRAINRPFYPPPPLPPVDFERDMIVIAALGTRPTAGYDIVIEGARQDSAAVEIALRTLSPAPGCPVSAAMTQPVDLATIPASQRAVRFREKSIVVPCGAP